MMVVRLWFIWGLKPRECVYMGKGSGWCFLCLKHNCLGSSLAVQCLGLGAFTAMAQGLIPGWGTKILQHAAWPKKLNKHKKYLNYFPESVQYDVIFQVFPTPRQGKNMCKSGRKMSPFPLCPPPEPHPSLHLASFHVLLSSSQFNCEEAMNGYS